MLEALANFEVFLTCEVLHRRRINDIMNHPWSHWQFSSLAEPVDESSSKFERAKRVKDDVKGSSALALSCS